jgi:hypothetical protein
MLEIPPPRSDAALDKKKVVDSHLPAPSRLNPIPRKGTDSTVKGTRARPDVPATMSGRK